MQIEEDRFLNVHLKEKINILKKDIKLFGENGGVGGKGFSTNSLGNLVSMA